MTEKFYFITSEIPEQLLSLLKGRKTQFNFSDLVYSEYSHLWGSHEWAWIVQTFLYMKQAGLDVEIVDQPVANSICITHFVTTKDKVWAPDSFVVGIRSDNSPMCMKEYEIVQSPAVLSPENSSFICHWPQSHLLSRNAARGNRVENMSYFGGVGGIAPAFYSEEFKSALSDLGVSLNLCFDTNLWGDYSDTDLVIAVRNHHHRSLIDTKPASKLINSWQAGCVPLLGREPAYRAVGTPNENYFEVETPQDVLSIVRQLKDNPAIYQQVRESGMQKYSEYSFEAIAQQWVDLLTGPVTEAFLEWQNASRQSKSSRYPRRCWQSVRQWLDHKLFYIPIRSQALIGKIVYQQVDN